MVAGLKRCKYASLKAGMRRSSALTTGFLAMVGVVCAQDTTKGLPARVAATEYQAHAQAGDVTVAAEFRGHSVPTPEATYTTEDYVIVEAALFGAPQARAKLAVGDFSLRINGKKVPLASQPYELAFKSLKDPEWEPPTKEAKSKTSIGGNGGGDTSSTPAVVHMPMELRRAMEQRVQKSAMLEGDRALPQAGLLFFEYRGKTQSIRSLELIYSGSAGNATLTLQP